MATLTSILGTDLISASRAVINNNYQNLNVDKAETASPTFTGTPIAPTASFGTDTTQIATTAFVQQSVSSVISFSGAAVRNSAATTTSPIPWDIEEYDTANYHMSGVNDTRLTIPTTGTYLTNFCCPMTGSGAQTRVSLSLIKNGDATTSVLGRVGENINSASDYGGMAYSGMHQFNANDYIEVIIGQLSGTGTVKASIASFSILRLT